MVLNVFIHTDGMEMYLWRIKRRAWQKVSFYILSHFCTLAALRGHARLLVSKDYTHLFFRHFKHLKHIVTHLCVNYCVYTVCMDKRAECCMWVCRGYCVSWGSMHDGRRLKFICNIRHCSPRGSIAFKQQRNIWHSWSFIGFILFGKIWNPK